MSDTVAAIVERELGSPPDRVCGIEEGLLHETYAVVVGGERFVLQFAAPELSDRRDSLARGVYWYGALADSPVPVPTVVSDGVATQDGCRYALVAAVPGETAERDVTPERTRAAGACLARIHEARAFERAGWLAVDDGGASVVSFDERSAVDHVRAVAEECATTLRAAEMAAGDALADLLERASWPAGFGEVVLCHDDFSPDNVGFREATVTGVLDFDRAYAGPAVRDVVGAANAFWMHDPGADWPVRRRFYEGYRSVRSLGDRFERVESLYRVTTLGGAVAGMYDLGELSDYERAFYDEHLLAAVDRASG
jgi:Ser/Thr protein kinase RdoA (MazF antagonist)